MLIMDARVGAGGGLTATLQHWLYDLNICVKKQHYKILKNLETGDP